MRTLSVQRLTRSFDSSRNIYTLKNILLLYVKIRGIFVQYISSDFGEKLLIWFGRGSIGLKLRGYVFPSIHIHMYMETLQIKSKIISKITGKDNARLNV